MAIVVNLCQKIVQKPGQTPKDVVTLQAQVEEIRKALRVKDELGEDLQNLNLSLHIHGGLKIAGHRHLGWVQNDSQGNRRNSAGSP